MTIAAILAGGASRRMGRPKPAVPLGGRRLIDHPIAAAEAAGLTPLVVARADSELPPLSAGILIEPGPERHPLAGLLAALDHAGGEPIVALGCDMPFVPPGLLRELSRRAPTAISAGGVPQPLLASYPPGSRPAIVAARAAGEPARRALARVRPRLLEAEALERFGDPAWIAFNVNTPADRNRAERRLAGSA
jgi:molybdenum cofactor guanylyltransferase